MRLRNVLLILFCLLAIPFVGIKAECTGWSVTIDKQDTALCSAQSLALSMIVHNDTASLDPSSEYRWYVKKPSASDYELLTETTISTTYSFDEVGVYSVKAAARLNECTIYHESSPISIELYPALTVGTIGNSQTICYNSIPEALSQLTSPIGGNSEIALQWQASTDNGSSWSNIAGEHGTSLTLPQLTQTTKYRIQYSSCEAIDFSNEVTISVRTPATAPTITSAVTPLCYNQGTATLSVIQEAVGAFDETFDYQWQDSSDGTEFSDISGATGTNFTTPTQTSARWYRVVATSSRGCGSIASPSVKVDVYPDWSISNTSINPLCYMTGGEISVSATGAENNYLYQWQESNDGSAWSNISSANTSHYSIPGKIAGTYYYRALVAPTTGCASKFSDVFTVIVYEDLTAGTIIGTDTVCYNNAPALLSQTIAPTGGNGQFTYQWQQRTTGAWSDILGATETTYQPDALTTTTYFRLVATTTCGSIISDSVEVYVRKDLTYPIITSSVETVCYGFAPALISIPTLATCDVHDSLTYQWQQKTSGDWSNIYGATALTYQPESITIAHQYRVIATSVKGCGQRESNVHTVNVYDDLTITASNDTSLCYMTRGLLSVDAHGEGDSYNFQWQDSTEGVWSDIPGGNNATYNTPRKAGGKYYYRCIVIPDHLCTRDTSSVITVTVYNDVNPGTIALNGADTICYGFTPDAISVSTQATGGVDGVYEYQWLRKQEGSSVFSPISGANGTTYAPSALYKTTEYQLEVTNACGDPKTTNSVKIYVRDEMQTPVLAEHADTICYNTIPDPIITTKLPTGGVDDSFTYQWEVSENGSTYTAIEGETTTTFQPEALLKTTYYRLRATSVKACGNVVSNAVKVNVYDSLHITAKNPDTLCYKTSTTISVTATGGGDSFGYQWQELIDGVWTNIGGATSLSYSTEPRVKGDYLYRCIVSSNKCDDYARISPEIKVSVYDKLTPGTIIGTDSTCYGFAPAEPLHVDVPASGVDGHYTYQWQVLENDKWKDIKKETKTSYQPEALTKGTEYRLQVASKCDTLATNSIFVRINPLPEIQAVTGPNNVCYNQHEIYSVEKLNPGFTYEWMLDKGEGVLTTEVLNTTSIDVLWKNPDTKDVVILRVTNDQTGCERDMTFGVSICNEQAPERTTIVRKPNSNILVCAEDGELVYQWGYTEKSTLQVFPIEDSNRRYVLLPHTFDNVAYDYWLTLRHSETSPCYSRSYYSADNDTVITPSIANVSVPSYVRERIPIVVQNPNEAQIICALYTLSGEPVGRYDLGNALYLSTTLPISVHSGMYVMHVSMGDYVKSIKLIAE